MGLGNVVCNDLHLTGLSVFQSFSRMARAVGCLHIDLLYIFPPIHCIIFLLPNSIHLLEGFPMIMKGPAPLNVLQFIYIASFRELRFE